MQRDTPMWTILGGLAGAGAAILLIAVAPDPPEPVPPPAVPSRLERLRALLAPHYEPEVETRGIIHEGERMRYTTRHGLERLDQDGMWEVAWSHWTNPLTGRRDPSKADPRLAAAYERVRPGPVRRKERRRKEHWVDLDGDGLLERIERTTHGVHVWADEQAIALARVRVIDVGDLDGDGDDEIWAKRSGVSVVYGLSP